MLLKFRFKQWIFCTLKQTEVMVVIFMVKLKHRPFLHQSVKVPLIP